MHRARQLQVLTISLLTLACWLVRPAAAGINLSWNDCGAFGDASTPLVCTTNIGAITMVVSVRPTVSMPQVGAGSAVIDLQTNATAISPWWDLRAGGGCRPAALTSSFVFTSLTNCADPWMGQAGGGLEFIDAQTTGYLYAPNRAQIRIAIGMPTGMPATLTA